MCIYIYTHIHSCSHIILHHIPSQVIRCSSLCWDSSISLLIHSKCSSFHLLTPDSQSIHSLPLRLGNHMSVLHVRELLQQRAGSRNKQLLLLTENQIISSSGIWDMGRCKGLGSLKSFLWSTPQLSGASILYFHSLSFLQARCQEWLQSGGCSMAGILCFLPEFPQGSLAALHTFF